MKILALHEIPEIAFSKIRSNDIEVELVNKRTLKKEDILNCFNKTSYDGVISLLTDKIDKEIIQTMKKNGVKIIANYAVGYNNIDIEAAKSVGLIVTNTPGVLTDSVAEHTLALMFATSKRIVEADYFTRSGKFEGWKPKLLLGRDLKNKTLAILGAGRIGTRVAELSKALGMKIIYYNQSKNEKLEKELDAIKYEDANEIFSKADIISIHLPLTESTRRFVNKERLANMKETAILINTSRGAVIDEKELFKTLEAEKIFAAGLDVFENEPEITSGLIGLKNVILTPHTASATFTTRNNMATIVAENIVAVLHGGKPTTPVFE